MTSCRKAAPSVMPSARCLTSDFAIRASTREGSATRIDRGIFSISWPVCISAERGRRRLRLVTVSRPERSWAAGADGVVRGRTVGVAGAVAGGSAAAGRSGTLTRSRSIVSAAVPKTSSIGGSGARFGAELPAGFVPGDGRAAAGTGDPVAAEGRGAGALFAPAGGAGVSTRKGPVGGGGRNPISGFNGGGARCGGGCGCGGCGCDGGGAHPGDCASTGCAGAGCSVSRRGARGGDCPGVTGAAAVAAATGPGDGAGAGCDGAGFLTSGDDAAGAGEGPGDGAGAGAGAVTGGATLWWTSWGEAPVPARRFSRRERASASIEFASV